MEKKESICNTKHHDQGSSTKVLFRRMKRACPTIQELLIFDAVARYESLSLAAEDLCLSVSGVSKQIAGLQKFVGRELLKKKGRGVELTPTGKSYWIKISPHLRMIESATAEARNDRSGEDCIVLASAPTFLAKSLIPKLPDFRNCYPNAKLVFRHYIGLREAFPSNIDAAISHGQGQWSNVAHDFITGREFVCILSPVLLEKTGPIRTPKNLMAHPLLHLGHAALGWGTWAKHHGLDEVQALSGLYFAQYSAVIQAVMSGLGIGLVPRFLVEDLLRKGRIIESGSFVDRNQGHYLCYRTDKPQRPVFSAFRSWLLEQWGADSS